MIRSERKPVLDAIRHYITHHLPGVQINSMHLNQWDGRPLLLVGWWVNVGQMFIGTGPTGVAWEYGYGCGLLNTHISTMVCHVRVIGIEPHQVLPLARFIRKQVNPAHLDPEEYVYQAIEDFQ